MHALKSLSGRFRASAPDYWDTPGKRSAATQFDAVVEEAFNALSAETRMVIRLVDVVGLSYAQVARVLGMPEGAVARRLHRGRSRIRDRLVTVGLLSTDR